MSILPVARAERFLRLKRLGMYWHHRSVDQFLHRKQYITSDIKGVLDFCHFHEHDNLLFQITPAILRFSVTFVHESFSGGCLWFDTEIQVDLRFRGLDWSSPLIDRPAAGWARLARRSPNHVSLHGVLRATS